MASSARAAETAPNAALSEDRGFSYFLGLGGQTIRYRESSASLPVKSTVQASSPLLITGAFYPVDEDILFSLHTETTFAPGEGTEKWLATSPTFNGVTLTSRLLQENAFNLSQSRTQLLGHYRLRDEWFVVAGPALHTQSFKRYAYTIGPDGAVSTPSNTTVEESSSEVLLNLGLALESERVRGQDSHYGVRALVGVPVWRRLQNTDLAALRFSSRDGVDVGLEGRYSWSVYRGIHVGLWGQWLSTYRAGEMKAGAEAPASRLTGLSYGLEMLWKL